MPAPEERINLNEFMQLTLQGVDDSGNLQARSLLIRRDRALVIWSRLVGFDGTRERIHQIESTGTPKHVVYGKDSGSTERAFRTTALGTQRTYPWRPVTVLAQGQLPTSTAAALYTVPASTTARIRFFSAFNTNAAQQTVDVFVDAAGTQRQIGIAVLDQDEHARFIDEGEELQLASGDAIYAQTTTATAVDYIISGEEEPDA
jgi:hypothetical protein